MAQSRDKTDESNEKLPKTREMEGECWDVVVVGLGVMGLSTVYQAKKARMESTMITIAVYLMAAKPVIPEPGPGSCSWYS